MSMRALALASLCSLAMSGVCPSAHALTQDEIVAKIQSAGYSQVRRVPSGKIESFRAVKNGKEVSVIVDSTGHVKEVQ
jgi:outer membrane lipoprotein SlyB